MGDHMRLREKHRQYRSQVAASGKTIGCMPSMRERKLSSQ